MEQLHWNLQCNSRLLPDYLPGSPPNRPMLLSWVMISAFFLSQALPGRSKYILVVLCFRHRGTRPELLELLQMLFACLRSSYCNGKRMSSYLCRFCLPCHRWPRQLGFSICSFCFVTACVVFAIHD